MLESDNIDKTVYPWLEAQWEQLLKRVRTKNVPHAILLTGPVGNGKFDLANKFAQYLLCSDPLENKAACGQCQSCYWFKNHSHPDVNEVLPSGKSETIKVDQIRDLCQRLSLTSHSGGFQIGLIYPVEKMNLNAANSLLKSLEEPTVNSLYILVSHEPGQLPATIRSRCQQFNMASPDITVASQWLVRQGLEVQTVSDLMAISRTPLAALKLYEQEDIKKRQQLAQDLLAVIGQQASLVSTAEKWAKQNIPLINLWLHSWVSDMVKARFDSNNVYQHNPDVKNTLLEVNKRVNLSLLFRVHDQLVQTNKILTRSANHQMLAESILFSWVP